MNPPPITPGLATAKQQLAESPPLHPHGDLAAWKSTVVFAPHPDDESLGCGGLIALLRRREQTVHVVFVSDGAMSHPNSREYPYAARAGLRRKEAKAACAILGVPEGNVYFFDYPDGGVAHPGQSGFTGAVSRCAQLLDRTNADTVLVPWQRDPHPDHRATHAICKAASEHCAQLQRWIMYPIWLWNAKDISELPRPEEVVAWRIDVSAVLDRKEAAIQAHRSQLGHVIHDDPTGFSLWEEMLDNFRRPTEVFFEEATKRDSTLGDEYFRTVYSASKDPWQFETSPYETAKYRHTLEALPRSRYAQGFEIGCSIGVLTALLAPRCDYLLSVDTVEAPLAVARQRLRDHPRVSFKKMRLPAEFPTRRFDLVVLSEVGYYWSAADLEKSVALIRDHLVPGGTLLLVHYTPYVPDYPLTGDEVHDTFAANLGAAFLNLRQERQERYRLDVWQRTAE